jgi:hypothetical protein
MLDTVTIESRFNGPAQSANGGWTGGLLARRFYSSQGSSLDLGDQAPFPSVSVSLRAPPPLDVPLQIYRNEDASLTLRDGERDLAHAQLEPFELSLPKTPSLTSANNASAVGFRRGLNRASWPYAKCFACGVSRSDGLCITPSPVGEPDSGDVVAASWTPSVWLAERDGQVKLEAVWAALDCPAGIAWSYQLPEGAPMVTARMSVSIIKLPRVNQPHIVLGWPIERDGRKLYAGTAVLSPDGELLARSRQLWLLPKSTQTSTA